MSKFAKILVCIAAIALVGLSGATAQAAPTGNNDAKLFSLDLGLATGYGLSGAAPLVGKTFGINFSLSDNLAIGFVSTTATYTYTLARLSYALNPTLGFNLYIGSDSNAASTAGGVGAYYNLFRSRSDASLSTVLKLRLEYLMDATGGFGQGDLVLGIVSSIGL